MLLNKSISKKEYAAGSLIVLSVALLPLGRTVEITTLIMAFCGLVLCFRKNEFKLFLKTYSARMFFAFFLLCWLPMVISIIDSENFKNAALFSLKYLRFLLAGFFVLYFMNSHILKDRLLTSLVIVICFWLFDSIFQWLVGIDLFGRTYQGDRLTGPFKNLIMPVFLTIYLPLVLASCSKNWPRYATSILLLVSLWILLMAGSRASLLVLILGGFLYLGLAFGGVQKKPVVPLILISVAILAIGVVSYQFNEGFQHRLDKTMALAKGDYESVNIATSYRLPIWEAAYKMAIDKPINGIGIKGFKDAFHRYAPPHNQFEETGASHPHLFLLEVFSETGLIGVAGMLAIFVLFINSIKHKIKKWRIIELGAGITIMIVFFPLNSHTSFYGSNYSQAAWLMIAICCSILYGSLATNDSAKQEQDT